MIIIVMVIPFVITACRRKKSPTMSQSSNAVPTIELGEVEYIDEPDFSLEEGAADGHIGSVEIDGADCPLLLYEGITYFVKNNEAWVVNSLFSDETLEDIVIKDRIAYGEQAVVVTGIYDQAFYYYDQTVRITLPSTIKNIGICAFDSCELLEEINLPEGLKTIGDSAFNECTSLKEITIPSTAGNLGSDLFFGCTSLESVTFSEGITSIPFGTFSNCESLKQVSLPSTLTVIGDEAFWYCEALDRIDLPEGLNVIGNRCFYDCTSLTEIKLPAALSSVGDGLFDYCDSLETVYVPNDRTGFYQELFEFDDFEVKGY